MTKFNFLIACFMLLLANGYAQTKQPKFKVLAFFTGKSDLAHISFVKESHDWFFKQAANNGFQYDTTSNWNKMNNDTLSKYNVVVFLDTRPPKAEQRAAFEQYMEHGGAWIGFHFSAFALTPSAFPQDWDWYHEKFLGSGQYGSNTWRPTSAILRVEDKKHPVTKGLPTTFKASPNEWYRWEHDLRKNKDIKILLAVDSSSFPLGTGPKQHEIWHSGYYPVAWTNTKYRMIYVNMGHNDMDYEGGTNATLSHTFDNDVQNKLILQSLLWLGKGKK
ncbi:trehalose utilization protein [Chitinophaga skermanii]|uniref:Trehalose utilization protein n=1 Tax=Chitinophaga skermanii TaxID=331697 RepID=A0A327QLG6_9BACT|nr:ThuA domain-containing protein [Chitinophaga skermanii]RAJ05161.1 trehalose utilization protein [Chitinophaga skermanii]